MDQVWLLLHSYEYFGLGDDKILGIYSTQALAEAAKQRYMQQEGFCEHPSHCFSIQPYAVDKDDAMCEGFFRWGDSEAYHSAFISLTEIMNGWLQISSSARDSWEDEGYYEALTEISWKLRHTEDAEELGKFIHHILVSCADTFRPLEVCVTIAKQLLSEVKL